MDLYVPRFIEQKKPFEIELKTTLSGKYKIEVCRNGHVTRKPFGDRWLPNLITNSGLDLLMNGNYMYNVIAAGARVGSGTTTPTITDTALTTPLRGTTTQFTGGGTGTTIGTSNDTVNGAVTDTNVFEFAAESSSVTYNEVALANTVGPTGGTIYTHSLFPSGVSLVSGDNLRLTYSMTFSIPATVTPVTVSLSAINGFNISGQLKVVGTFQGIFAILVSTGGTNGGNDAPLRNSSAGQAALLSSPTTFPPVNTALSGPSLLGSGLNGTQGTYTAGSFTRTQQYIWIPSNPSTTVTNVNAIIFATAPITAPPAALMLLLTTAQTKANTNTLTVNTSSTIARA